MSVLAAAWWLGTIALLVWMLSRLVQAPRHPPLWAVTGLVACWVASQPFERAAEAQTEFLGLAPLTCQLVQCVLLQSGACCMVYFFLFSALDLRRARRRAVRYTLPLVAAVTVQTAAVLSAPAHVETTDFTVTNVLVFRLTAVLYMILTFTLACVWTRRYARKAEPRLARGLRIASVGQVAIALSDCLFVPVGFMRWSGDHTGPGSPGDHGATAALALAAETLLMPGAVLLLVGISYQSVAMRLAAVRVWGHHLRAYRRLRPLWTTLHQHFPEDILHDDHAAAGRRRDAANLRAVHRRYYRRVIECRDGLVHISPYLAAVRHDDGDGQDSPTPAVLAEQLKRALRAHAAGTRVSTAAMPIGIPAEENLDADVEELVALSQAL